MENLITLIKSLPVTLKPNKMMVFNGVIISIFMFCTNYEDIKENLFKKDLVEEFVEKTSNCHNQI